jgi:hypothetical protein
MYQNYFSVTPIMLTISYQKNDCCHKMKSVKQIPVLNTPAKHVLNQVLIDCDYNHKLMVILFLDLCHQKFTAKK